MPSPEPLSRLSATLRPLSLLIGTCQPVVGQHWPPSRHVPQPLWLLGIIEAVLLIVLVVQIPGRKQTVLDSICLDLSGCPDIPERLGVAQSWTDVPQPAQTVQHWTAPPDSPDSQHSQGNTHLS
ncbi:hypothetical protein EDD16DRAFT_1522408 [Pisolithus croceorrhizus]|nr:hypothetical protein EDD16DRAFT_1522408 [Pisolithus croceorrhizus]